jgi:hypothetical protein
VKRLIGVLLLLAAGCSGFDPPTSDRLKGLPLDPLQDPPTSTPPRISHTRCRFHLSVDSPSLAGEFDGIAVAVSGVSRPVVRAQLFGDFGPKILDLMCRPDRIVGYFPQTREGIDCALPGEAAPHFVLFMGASLLEEFLPRVGRPRVTGIRDEDGGSWLRLQPAIEGLETVRFMSRSSDAKKRKYRWMYGLGWEEDWPTAEECRIAASGVSIRVRILERTLEAPVKPESLELTLPADVRIVKGTRK